jgi:hypothetical protein
MKNKEIKIVVTLSTRKKAESYIADFKLSNCWIQAIDSHTFQIKMYV